MNSYERIWKRLVVLARGGETSLEPIEPPPGFATRVAALAVGARADLSTSAVWEWLAIRGLAIACIITVASLMASWPMFSTGSQDDLADLADTLVVADASR